MKTLLTLLALGFVISASAQERRVERPATRPAARPTGTIAPIIDPDARPVPREAVLRNDSLLKVNVTYQGYAPHIPWQKESPGQRRGLGVHDFPALVTERDCLPSVYMRRLQLTRSNAFSASSNRPLA